MRISRLSLLSPSHKDNRDKPDSHRAVVAASTSIFLKKYILGVGWQSGRCDGFDQILGRDNSPERAAIQDYELPRARLPQHLYRLVNGRI